MNQYQNSKFTFFYMANAAYYYHKKMMQQCLLMSDTVQAWSMINTLTSKGEGLTSEITCDSLGIVLLERKS